MPTNEVDLKLPAYLRRSEDPMASLAAADWFEEQGDLESTARWRTYYQWQVAIQSAVDNLDTIHPQLARNRQLLHKIKVASRTTCRAVQIEGRKYILIITARHKDFLITVCTKATDCPDTPVFELEPGYRVVSLMPARTSLDKPTYLRDRVRHLINSLTEWQSDNPA